ncbi:MAG: hypothetical protein PHG05_02350 [Candidatus Nanoarchaeia archaeon]|nr:hypothetical protein [Candidatus Nanoarchaeia archaeon]
MGDTLLSLVKIVVGIIFIALPIFALIFNFYGLWDAVWILIKAGVVLGIVAVGIIFLILGFMELK